MQPWSWIYKAPVLLLLLDRERTDSLLDFEQSGSLVALGAATENLVLAAHHHGLEVRIRLFPDTRYPDAAAVFEFFRDADNSTEPHVIDELYEVVGIRHTNRALGSRKPIPEEKLEALCRAATSVFGAHLIILTGQDALTEAGGLLGAGDRLRILNQQMHSEMMAETRWTIEEASHRKDGIAIRDLHLSSLDEAGLELLRSWDTLECVRRWGGGTGLEQMSQKALDAASAVALLTMPEIRQRDYFEGGRAVQRIWLRATMSQIAFQPMTVLPYLFARECRGSGEGLTPDTREGLRALHPRYEALFELDRGRAEVMLFRLSQATKPPHRSLRRAVADVLLFVD